MSPNRRLQLTLILGLALNVLSVAVHAGGGPAPLNVAFARTSPVQGARGLSGFLLLLSRLVADVATPAVIVLLTAATSAVLSRVRLARVGET